MTQVYSKIQNTDGMEDLKNDLLSLGFGLFNVA